MNKGYHWQTERLPHSEDRGCRYAPKCISCPFPLFDNKCLNDLSPIKREALFSKLDFRNEVLYKGFLAGGDVEDYKKIFNLSGEYIRKIIAKEYKKIWGHIVNM